MDDDLPKINNGTLHFLLAEPPNNGRFFILGIRLDWMLTGFEIKGRPVVCRDDQKLTLSTKSQNMVAPYMTRIKLPATWTYMYEKLVNISAWYMVQCNNYQSVHLWYVRTGMFVFSAILFCVLRYCCAVVPSSNKIPGCKCQVMADSPKRNSLVWPGRIRFWLFHYFSLSDKATEIQSKQKESNVSEKKTGDGDISHRLGKQQN